MGFDGSGAVFPARLDRDAARSYVSGKRVAIDSAGIVYQARGSCKTAFAKRVGSLSARAWRRAAVRLLLNRCAQLTSRGAHPVVVLEGEDGKYRGRNGASRGRSHDWQIIIATMAELCERAGITCVHAPSDGEAMCAHLTAAGVCDVVWTEDVNDALLFGATAVVSCGRVSARNRPSPLAARVDASAHMMLVRHVDVRPGLAVYAAHLQTDWTPGVKGMGPVKAALRTKQLVSQHHSSGVIAIDMNAEEALYSFVADHGGAELASHLKAIDARVRHQKSMCCAELARAGLTRGACEWHASKCDQGSLLKLIKDNISMSEAKSGKADKMVQQLLL